MSDTEKIIQLIDGQVPSRKLTINQRGATGAAAVELVDTDGDAISLSGGFGISNYDYISVNYSTSTTEIYTFKTGGSSGTTIATLTVVYTDSTKEFISSVTKT